MVIRKSKGKNKGKGMMIMNYGEHETDPRTIPILKVRKEAPFVGIAGSIGVGKTTVTEALSARLGGIGLYEEFKSNPFLEKFYKDPSRWSYHVQTWFLFNRYRRHFEATALRLRGSILIADRTIYEDGVFAKTLEERGEMSEEEYSCYAEHFRLLNGSLRQPDCMIYLTAPVDVLMHRITLRDRKMECGIPREYMEHLQKNYDKWYEQYEGRKFNIDTYMKSKTEVADMVESILDAQFGLKQPVMA